MLLRRVHKQRRFLAVFYLPFFCPDTFEMAERVKEVSRVLKESVKCVSRKFQKQFQGHFKNVSMKFCFAILILHGSHRSYPSRRRACYSDL